MNRKIHKVQDVLSTDELSSWLWMLHDQDWLHTETAVKKCSHRFQSDRCQKHEAFAGDKFRKCTTHFTVSSSQFLKVQNDLKDKAPLSS